MPFGDNTKLIRDADPVEVASNGTNDRIDGTPGSTAFSFKGGSGDDRVINFGKHDTILNYQKIFDGNDDGIIDFGANGILDISRASKKKAGADQITVQGLEGNQLRYLGSKDGQHVYADASVRQKGFIEGSVGNDSFDASRGANKYFYDTALGLNLGGDTIKGFGTDDELITTSALFNGKKGAFSGAEITYGKNGVLDLSGEFTNTKGDDGVNHGGQIDLVGTHGIYFHGAETINGVTYYHYGTAAPAY